MEEEKYMMVAEDLIKEPPAVPCCQKKNNGLSELDFSPRNSTVAKPECIILSPLVSLKGKNIVFKIFLLTLFNRANYVINQRICSYHSNYLNTKIIY